MRPSSGAATRVMRLCLIAALPNAAALLAGPGPLLTPRPPLTPRPSLVPLRGSPAPTMLSPVESESSNPRDGAPASSASALGLELHLRSSNPRSEP